MITMLNRIGRFTQNMYTFAQELHRPGVGLRMVNLGGGDGHTANTHGIDAVHDHGRYLANGTRGQTRTRHRLHQQTQRSRKEPQRLTPQDHQQTDSKRCPPGRRRRTRCTACPRSRNITRNVLQTTANTHRRVSRNLTSPAQCPSKNPLRGQTAATHFGLQKAACRCSWITHQCVSSRYSRNRTKPSFDRTLLYHPSGRGRWELWRPDGLYSHLRRAIPVQSRDEASFSRASFLLIRVPGPSTCVVHGCDGPDRHWWWFGLGGTAAQLVGVKVMGWEIPGLSTLRSR